MRRWNRAGLKATPGTRGIEMQKVNPECSGIRVVLAQPRGFCAGVVRAISIVERALEKYEAPVFVRHEIVHNKHVVEALKAKGACFVDEINEIPHGAVTIFSAHGVSKSVENAAQARSLPVIDATCPLVTKVHLQGKKYLSQGRSIILVGHAGHPEVEGTMGRIPGPVHLVQTEDDVKSLPLADDTPVAYVTNTTLSIDDTRGIIDALKRRLQGRGRNPKPTISVMQRRTARPLSAS